VVCKQVKTFLAPPNFTALPQTPALDPPLHWTALNWSCSGAGPRHTCNPKGFMYYSDHFISTSISLIESYLALSYVLS